MLTMAYSVIFLPKISKGQRKSKNILKNLTKTIDNRKKCGIIMTVSTRRYRVLRRRW